MRAKYKVGEVVTTIVGSQIKATGPIREIVIPSTSMQMLWGDKQPHYLVRDIETGEFISVREKGIERV